MRSPSLSQARPFLSEKLSDEDRTIRPNPRPGHHRRGLRAVPMQGSCEFASRAPAKPANKADPVANKGKLAGSGVPDGGGSTTAGSSKNQREGSVAVRGFPRIFRPETIVEISKVESRKRITSQTKPFHCSDPMAGDNKGSLSNFGRSPSMRFRTGSKMVPKLGTRSD